jgi:hypothetical protein
MRTNCHQCHIHPCICPRHRSKILKKPVPSEQMLEITAERARDQTPVELVLNQIEAAEYFEERKRNAE